MSTLLNQRMTQRLALEAATCYSMNRSSKYLKAAQVVQELPVDFGQYLDTDFTKSESVAIKKGLVQKPSKNEVSSTPSPTAALPKLPWGTITRSVCRVIASELVSPMMIDAKSAKHKQARAALNRDVLYPRLIPYDEMEHHIAKLQTMVKTIDPTLSNFMILPVGPHRRGAPFSNRVELLLSHKDAVDDSRCEILVKKLLRPCQSSGYLKFHKRKDTSYHCSVSLSHGFAQSKVEAGGQQEGKENGEGVEEAEVPDLLSRIANRPPQWDEDGANHVATKDEATAEKKKTKPPTSINAVTKTVPDAKELLFHFVPLDQFYSRLIHLTGPKTFLARFQDHCADTGSHLFRASTSGLLVDLKTGHVVPGTCEKDVFDAVKFPYVHPTRRY